MYIYIYIYVYIYMYRDIFIYVFLLPVAISVSKFSRVEASPGATKLFGLKSADATAIARGADGCLTRCVH